MENYNEGLDSQITDDTNSLNQIVEQSDFAVSDTVASPVQEDPKPKKKQASTNNAPLPETSSFLSGLGRTSKKIKGNTISDTGTISDGRDIDKYKKYLPGEGSLIYTPLDLWDKERAIRQSNWDQAGNATLRVLGNIVPEILQQGSRMLDFSGDYSSDNFLGTAMQKWKDAVNEGAPIYRENPDTPMDFGDFAYWMEQGSNLVTSAAAFAAIGYATAGVGGVAMRTLGTGAKALSAGRTGAGIAQFLETTGNGLLNTYLMNRAEGVGVAIDT